MSITPRGGAPVSVQPRSSALDMRVRPKAGSDFLGRQLVDQGLISETELERALSHQERTGRRIGETLFELGLISSPELTRVLAERRGIPFVDLGDTAVDPTVARAIPSSMARLRGMVPLYAEDDTVVLGMVNPEDGDALTSVRAFVGVPVRAVMCDPEGLVDLVESVWPEGLEPVASRTRHEAGPIARDMRLYRLACRRLGQGDAMWSPDEVVAWTEVALLHALHLAGFLGGDGADPVAADFVPGWPGDDEKVTDVIARLGAVGPWLAEARRRTTHDDHDQDEAMFAQLDGIRHDLDRVSSAFIAALPADQRDWFTT